MQPRSDQTIRQVQISINIYVYVQVQVQASIGKSAESDKSDESDENRQVLFRLLISPPVPLIYASIYIHAYLCRLARRT